MYKQLLATEAPQQCLVFDLIDPHLIIGVTADRDDRQ
jgi:hypothetical protein